VCLPAHTACTVATKHLARQKERSRTHHSVRSRIVRVDTEVAIVVVVGEAKEKPTVQV